MRARSWAALLLVTACHGELNLALEGATVTSSRSSSSSQVRTTAPGSSGGHAAVTPSQATPPRPAVAYQSADEIPGTPVTRVGVNFEDLGDRDDNDRDYNDAVLCFEGQFNVDGSLVISRAPQRIRARTSSLSHCRHRIGVWVRHPDGSESERQAFDSREAGEVWLDFELGSVLEVTMTPTDGHCTRAERSMHEPAHCRVRVDECNTSGR